MMESGEVSSVKQTTSEILNVTEECFVKPAFTQ